MARYLAFNSLAGARRTSSNAVEVTTGGRFDSSYVPNAISVSYDGSTYFEAGAPFADGSASISGTIWLRFDLYQSFNSAIGGYSGKPILIFMNGASNAFRLATISPGGAYIRLEYWNGSTWVAWSSNFSLPLNSLQTLGIKIIPDTSCEIYVAGSLVASGGVVATQDAITAIQFWGAGGSNCFYSQVMCADYNLNDANYQLRTLTGDSAVNNAGTGTYTDVNEIVLNDSNMISLPAAGDCKTFTKAALAKSTAQQISALVVNTRGRNDGTVTGGKVAIRSGGANYESADKAYPASFDPRGNIWSTDPATSAPWTEANFNSAEVGLIAV